MRYNYKKEYEKMMVNEGVTNIIKRALKGLKGKLKPNSKEMKLLIAMAPLMIGTNVLSKLNTIAMETAEKMGIEMDPEEIFHVMHIAEHLLHTVTHFFASDQTNNDKESING